MVDVMLPKRTTEIKKNTVYMSGVYLEYPDKDDPRYYLEFKDDNTYVLMYDDSRRREENYNEDVMVAILVYGYTLANMR